MHGHVIRVEEMLPAQVRTSATPSGTQQAKLDPWRLAVWDTPEEGGDDVKSAHAPYGGLGYTYHV